VIIVKENHSFDNYFGSFPDVNGEKLPPAQDPPAGGDPRHDHAGWLERAAHAVKLQYSEKDIPAYFSFARQFTLCDNYFTEVASQSEPNHLMLIAAASPIIDNASKKTDVPAARALQNSDAAEGTGEGETYLGYLRGPWLQLFQENPGAERQPIYSAVD